MGQDNSYGRLGGGEVQKQLVNWYNTQPLLSFFFFFLAPHLEQGRVTSPSSQKSGGGWRWLVIKKPCQLHGSLIREGGHPSSLVHGRKEAGSRAEPIQQTAIGLQEMYDMM